MTAKPRSLPVDEWPEADRVAWAAACRVGARLDPGGAASRLSDISRKDFANRYGAFLGFLQRTGRLRTDMSPAAQVVPENVGAYLADLKARVLSYTIYNAVSKLRRTARLLAPAADYEWLLAIEKDIAFTLQPRSKLHRLVLTERLVEAGLTLIVEAKQLVTTPMARAVGIRNGLMVALLALCPIRLKNFAALELEATFREVDGSWWIVLPNPDTKTKRRDERPVPAFLKSYIALYVEECRPLLAAGRPGNALWISASTGRMMRKKAVGTLISKITLQALGVDVSPHLFRTAAASTAAVYVTWLPHLASALLGHTDHRVTDDHYIRNSSMNAASVYAGLVQEFIGR